MKLFILVAVLMLSACSDNGPTAPTPTPQFDVEECFWTNGHYWCYTP